MDLKIKKSDSKVIGPIAQFPTFSSNDFVGIVPNKRKANYPSCVYNVGGFNVQTTFNATEYAANNAGSSKEQGEDVIISFPDSMFAEAGDRVPRPVVNQNQ